MKSSKTKLKRPTRVGSNRLVMLGGWIACDSRNPKDGQDVQVKTRHGTIYDAVWCEDTTSGKKMDGWMINVTGHLHRNVGAPKWWRPMPVRILKAHNAPHEPSGQENVK